LYLGTRKGEENLSVIEYISTFSWLVVALLLVGIVLVVIEMLEPGVGVAGALGLACFIAAIILQAKNITEALVMGAVLFAVVGLLFLVFVRSISRGRLSKKDVTLWDKGEAGQGAHRYRDYIGKEGVAFSMLRPVGTGDFSGEKIEVVSELEYIQAGTPIKIIAVDGLRVVVRPLEKSQDVEQKETTDGR
jgi:membrane-bound serine protease (ClpP class)